MEDLIVDKVLGVKINVLCTDGKEHTINFLNLSDSENSTINIKKYTTEKNANIVSKYNIDIHIETINYQFYIDNIDDCVSDALSEIGKIPAKEMKRLGTVTEDYF